MAVPDKVKLYELDLFLMVYACASSYNVQFYDDIFTRLYDTLPTQSGSMSSLYQPVSSWLSGEQDTSQPFTFRRLLHPFS